MTAAESSYPPEFAEAWALGYMRAVEDAIHEIDIELRWQTELQMRGDPHAATLCDRLVVLKNIYGMRLE